MGILKSFAVLVAALVVPCAASAAWEPEKPVELIVPAGAGGSLDQMARLIQDIVVKHKLMSQELVVLNRPGGAGAEAFNLMKNGLDGTRMVSVTDPHRIMIIGNTLFTAPLFTGFPFNWADVSPVALLALEPFVLWTHAEARYKSAMEYIDAAKSAGRYKMKMAAAGSKQEPHILIRQIEMSTGARFTYLPLRGREATVLELVEQKIDATVSNPFEAGAYWRAGALTPHCVFNEARMPYQTRVTQINSWSDIPTCKEVGLDISYQSQRGIFMRARATDEERTYFISVFKKVVDTPEWKAYMEKGAYSQTFMIGQEFKARLSSEAETHRRVGKTFESTFRGWE